MICINDEKFAKKMRPIKKHKKLLDKINVHKRIQNIDKHGRMY